MSSVIGSGELSFASQAGGVEDLAERSSMNSVQQREEEGRERNGEEEEEEEGAMVFGSRIGELVNGEGGVWMDEREEEDVCEKEREVKEEEMEEGVMVVGG